MLYILGIIIATLILAVVGHLLWIFYKFLFRELIRLLARSRGQKDVDLTALSRRFFAHLFSVEQLGKMFGIKEAYACKLYHHHLDILIKVLRLPGRKALLEPNHH